MTLVGKIFAFLVLLLSFFFLIGSAMVYATHRNWRERSQELQKDLTAEQEKVRILQAEQNNDKMLLESERAARRFALATQHTKMAIAEEQRKTAVQKNVELLSKNGELVEQNRINVQELEKKTQLNAQLRKEILEAREDRNEKVAEVLVLTDELNQLRGDKRTLEARRNQLLEMVAEYKYLLDVNNIRPTDDPNAVPPQVDGVVVDVRDDLIQISIGSNDGLKVGHKLDVYRNKAYLGRAVIIRVTPNSAVANIIPDLKQGIIKVNDSVSTKLG